MLDDNRHTARLIRRIYSNAPEFGDLASSFDLHLQSVGRADETRSSYLEAIHQLVEFLVERHKSLSLDAVTRNDVRSFGVSLQRHKQPATVANRIRSLKVFFKWTVADGLAEDDPMTGFRTPKVPFKSIPVVEQEDLVALLDTCRRGKDFWDHRDYASFGCSSARARGEAKSRTCSSTMSTWTRV